MMAKSAIKVCIESSTYRTILLVIFVSGLYHCCYNESFGVVSNQNSLRERDDYLVHK